MSYQPTVWVDDDVPDITAARLNKMEAGIRAADAPLVTALPVAPFDGQRVLFDANHSANVVDPIWLLQYSQSRGKWRAISPQPLRMAGAQLVSFTSTSLIDNPTVVGGGGLSVVALGIPLDGEYAAYVTFEAWVDTAAGRVYVSANGTSDLTHIESRTANEVCVGMGYNKVNLTKTVGSASLRMAYRTTAGTGYIRARSYELYPLELTG